MVGLRDSILFLSDSYKVTHWKQYPAGTEQVYAYWESRGGKFRKTLAFGFQYILKKYLTGSRVTEQDLQLAVQFYRKHFGADLLNVEGWRYIINEHGGRLPVSIRAVPEGTLVDTQNVMMTVENTDPKVPWLTNYLETLLSQAWYPTTVGTLSYHMKGLIGHHLSRTSDLSPEDQEAVLSFKLHDFGFRGVSSVESAGIGGMAHLVNFLGTDTPRGIITAMDYYGADVCGFSIPASEHSTITSWGKENEAAAYENMLDQYPEGLVACVSDSYNVFKACKDIWGEKLKDKILARNGTLVVRPDSGDPADVVTRILEILGDKFGYTTNKRGFKVLPPQVRLIQGDGIDYDSCQSILLTTGAHGWSAENIAYGMGGALLQRLTRDTQKFAFKCSEITVNGESRPVQKDPVTDPGKRSKAGRLKLAATSETGDFVVYYTMEQSKEGYEDKLVEIFRDGELLVEETFDNVRQRAAAQ